MSRPAHQQRGSRRTVRRLQPDRRTVVRVWLMLGGSAFLVLGLLLWLARNIRPH